MKLRKMLIKSICCLAVFGFVYVGTTAFAATVEDVDNAKVALQSSDVASVLASLVDGGMQPQEAAATIVAAGGDVNAVSDALVSNGYATPQTAAAMMETVMDEAGILGFTPPGLAGPAADRVSRVTLPTPAGTSNPNSGSFASN